MHYAGSAVQHLFAVAAGLDSMVDRRGADPRPAARRLRRRGRSRARSGGRCTSCRSRRCASASGCTPAPGSTPRAPRSSPRPSPPPPRRSGASSRACGPSWSAPARWARSPRPTCAARRAAEIVVLNRSAGAGRSGSSRTPGAPAPRPGPRRWRRWRTSWPRRTCWWPAPARSARSSPARRCAAAVVARDGRPLAVCDLGLPRDVDPGVAALPGVTVVDLVTLQARLRPARARRGGRRRRRSWSPRRRRPTWPRSARPR